MNNKVIKISAKKGIKLIPKKQLGGKLTRQILDQLINTYGRLDAAKIIKNLQKFYGNSIATTPFINRANLHKQQMDLIKQVEGLGGQLGGSAYLAKYGTINRKGLLHDLDFQVTPEIRAKIGNGNGKMMYPFFIDEVINVPYENGRVTADMFIRNPIKSDLDRILAIFKAKKDFGRAKDLQDIQNFEFYSRSNPLVRADGSVQWNPTLFSSGILDNNNFPVIQLIETYPHSGIQVPVVMNDLGEIKRVL